MEAGTRVRGCVSPMQLFCEKGSVHSSSSSREWAARCVGKRSVGLTSPPLSDHNVNSGKSHSCLDVSITLPFPLVLTFLLSLYGLFLLVTSFQSVFHADSDRNARAFVASDALFWIRVNAPLHVNVDSLIKGCSRLKCD